jgi:short-chain Z-isoprenyl diphosphate synthase
VGVRDLVYGIYEKSLKGQIPPDRIPRHVGVILDGNRRWASLQGSTSSEGHRAGAAKIVEFLGWCDDVGVEVVTLWLLSTDNLARPAAELQALMTIIEDTVTGTRSAHSTSCPTTRHACSRKPRSPRAVSPEVW